MQEKQDERIWENKALREARESSHKNAVALLDIAERIGLLKKIESLDDLFTVFNGIRNRLFDQIYQDIPLHADELFNQNGGKSTGDFQKPASATDQTLVTVYLTDGDLKTIDVKDDIKKEGFKWDMNKGCWYKKMPEKNWEVMGKTMTPFNRLHAEIKKE
jgi:hypothetical protein